MKRSGFKRKVYDPNNPPTVKPRKHLAKVSKKKVKKVKKRKKKSLYKKAWDIQSKTVRTLAQGICFTCGAQNFENGEWTIKGTQAGHFKHGVLDFDPININCQCVRCNKWLHGNLGIYAWKLTKKYGADEVEALHIRASHAQGGERRTDEEYQVIIDKCTNLLKENERTNVL